MKKILFAVLIVFTLLSCSQQQEEQVYAVIKPLPSGIKVREIKDATVPVSFKVSSFYWPESTLTIDVWSEDLYDAVEVSLMQAGDTLIYKGQDIIVKTIENENGILTINGGIEEDGAYLKAYEGGTYRGLQLDDHSTYTHLGSTILPLAYDFRIIDCGEDFTDKYDTITMGQKLYMDSIQNVRGDFNYLNTRVMVVNGNIVEITRKWIP